MSDDTDPPEKGWTAVLRRVADTSAPCAVAVLAVLADRLGGNSRVRRQVFQFLLATEHDLEELGALRKEAVSWLGGQGTDQWALPWPTPEAQMERLRTSVRDGETWIVRDGQRLAATVAVDDYSDPRLWTADEQEDRALYIHRLIVSRAYSGCGLGRSINDWVAAWARQNGFVFLRVDIWTTNLRLQRYYSAIGYDHVRTVRVFSESTGRVYPSGALFQRRVRSAG